MENSYNVNFFVNACHVCKSYGVKSPAIKRCSGCKLISYCSQMHQRKHWSQHKALCQIVCKLYNTTNEPSIFKNCKGLNMEDWVREKTTKVLCVSLKMERELLLYEKQMFTFPRACAICHDSDIKNLKECPNCPNSNFCTEHFNNSEHQNLCRSFKLCFELDHKVLDAEICISKWFCPYYLEETDLPTSIASYIKTYNRDRTLSISAEHQEAYVSQSLTRVLTLMYAMKKLKYTPRNKLTVHIIGANMIEVASLDTWEILIHWFPSLIELNVILIGPEFNSINKNVKQNLCDCCVENKIEINIGIYGIRYDYYIKNEHFIIPDIVIGYNLGIAEDNHLDPELSQWTTSLRALSRLNCPFVFTSYTSTEASSDHKRLCTILKKNETYLYSEKNPFSSCRPHRDFETEGVFYQNCYITIYKDLTK